MPDAAPAAQFWAWAALAGLGAFHGVNPAMGWLFAVGRGLQSGRRATVLGSLAPIALGHLASVAVVIAGVEVLREFVDVTVLQVAAASGLIGFGAWRFARGYRHRFRVGMVAGFSDLVLWSFLMATAHGAGLMLAPVLLLLPAGTGLLALGAHTAAMFAVMGLTAWAVFEWVGLRAAAPGLDQSRPALERRAGRRRRPAARHRRPPRTRRARTARRAAADLRGLIRADLRPDPDLSWPMKSRPPGAPAVSPASRRGGRYGASAPRSPAPPTAGTAGSAPAPPAPDRPSSPPASPAAASAPTARMSTHTQSPASAVGSG